MAKKTSNNNSKAFKKTAGVGSARTAPAPVKEKEQLTKKQIIILVCVTLVAILISATITTTIIYIKRIDNPDFMKSDLSRYITISEDGYKGYTIDIPLDTVTEESVQRQIDMLITAHKTLNEEYKGRYPKYNPLSLGDTVKIYYRGYTVDENGREIEFENSSNIPGDVTILEVGTGNVIDASSGSAAGAFIPGFGESLVGVIPGDYPELDKLLNGRVMAGDVIYLSYTVIGGKDGANKTVENERIDLSLPYIDELYGKGFTEFFTGKYENGEATGFANIGEDLGGFICRIGDSATDTLYSEMKVEFVTRGCENDADNKPIKLEVRFPANYHEESLRGVEAFFDVFIYEAVAYDTESFDDKFITEKLKVKAEDLSSYSGATLADKYRSKIREELIAETEKSNKDLLMEAMWDHILDNVTVSSLPEKTVESNYNAYYSTIESNYANYTQSYSSIDSFAIAYLNYNYEADLASNDDWKLYIKLLAERDVTEQLVFYYIIREENFIPSNKQYEEIYDDIFSEMLDYYLNLHKEEFEKLEGDEYEKELNILKEEIKGYYGEDYFREQIYYRYGTEKMLSLAKIVK